MRLQPLIELKYPQMPEAVADDELLLRLLVLLLLLLDCLLFDIEDELLIA